MGQRRYELEQFCRQFGDDGAIVRLIILNMWLYASRCYVMGVQRMPG